MDQSSSVTGFEVENVPAPLSKSSSRQSEVISRLLVARQSLDIDEVADNDGFSDAAKDGLSFREAVTNFILCAIGSGITMFPSTMKQLGFITAPLVMATCAVVCSESGCLISNGCDLAEKYVRRGQTLNGYEDFAQVAGGKPMQTMCTITKNTTLLGVIVAYIIFLTNHFQIWTDELLPKNKAPGVLQIRFFIVLPIFILLAMVKDLKMLNRFQPVGVIAVVVQCCGIVYGCCRLKTNCKKCHYSPIQGGAGDIGASAAVFIFSFAVIKTVPNVRQEMAQPERLQSVVRVAFCIIFSLYMMVMVTGYWGLGDDVKSDVILNINHDSKEWDILLVGRIVAVALDFNILISSPIYMVCVFRTFEASAEVLSPANRICRGVVILILALIGSADSLIAMSRGEDPGKAKLTPKDFISLISSVFNSFNTIFWHLTLYLCANIIATRFYYTI